MAEVVADVEDEAHSNDHAHENGKEKGQAVDIALIPQCAKFRTAVFLHHHSPQEWRDEEYRQHSRDAVGIPVHLPSGQHSVHERQEEGEHDGNGGRGEDGVDNGVDCHLCQHVFPLAMLCRVGMAHGEMVQQLDELVGQVLLQMVVGRCRKPNHVRSKEGCNDGYSHYHRVEEIADDTQRKSQRGNDE